MADAKRRHAEEVATDIALAQRLLGAQFPDWTALSLSRVRAHSTDNDMYRLGDDMAVRLPRRASAVTPMDKEHAWLPMLAPLLPAPVPLPLAMGAPQDEYPYPWSVVRWIEGERICRRPRGIARGVGFTATCSAAICWCATGVSLA